MKLELNPYFWRFRQPVMGTSDPDPEPREKPGPGVHKRGASRPRLKKGRKAAVHK